MESSNKNYWCFRIDTNRQKFFKEEIFKGRLRQGWGWDEAQDLRNLKMDEGAGRNKPIFNNVKKGDILLVPQLPTWGKVIVVEATEDFNIGYQFSIDSKLGDYGHIFPVKYLKSFDRHNANIGGGIRSTLKNPSRFWNINHYANDVNHIFEYTDENSLNSIQNINDRLDSTIESTFNEIFDSNEFKNKLFENVLKQFTREEWEMVLVYGFKKIYPHFIVERVGGITEAKHGTDILIKIPSIVPDQQYAIAIQIKDYDNIVSSDVIDQINKADDYYRNLNLKLIEKIVIIIRSKKDQNTHLINNSSDVRFLFTEDLKQLFSEISTTYHLNSINY
ncbi:MAG: hypothetical protein KBA13_03195 [Chitinophagales bacterium]|nr:hypothetical protein [Chitinophagales bacterium]